MSSLQRCIVECVGSDGGMFGRTLVDYALHTLRLLAAQPGKKAVARVIETPHPYENNMVSFELVYP